MKRVLCFTIALIALSAPPAAAAQRGWALEEHSYLDPILAEPRAAQTSILFPAVADSFPFAVNDRRGMVWDISVGRELPIVGFSSRKAGEGPDGVPAGAFGFGVWFPLSFHVVEDLGKDPSNPILNTDYRFGGQVKAQWGLPEATGGWSSAHVGVKFQFGHESTHIGDEFTLGALRTRSSTFTRVNVSYEYYDVAGAFEPNVGADGRYQIRIRVGNIWLWRPREGWYARELLQPYGRFTEGSKRNHEPYLQLELYRQPGARSLGFIASADLRDRTVYQYNDAPDAARTNAGEGTEWSANVMAGVRHVRSGPGPFGRISPTYYVRLYHGVNPNGQFRSQAGFDELGFGVHFGL